MEHRNSGEKRRFKRIEFESDATLFTSSQACSTRLIDIALAGALVEEPETWEGSEGDLGRLELRLTSGITITMTVTVASRRNGRLGLHCERIDMQSFSHLKRLVELNLGSTELLHRELEALG